jgi:hypothetical protein
LPACTLHRMAKFALCLRQTCHSYASHN